MAKDLHGGTQPVLIIQPWEIDNWQPFSFPTRKNPQKLNLKEICQHFWNTLLLAEKSAKICECATFRGKICMETMSGGESGFKCFWPNCRVANQDMSTQVNLSKNIFLVTWDYLKNLLRSSAYFFSYLWVDLMKNHFHILQKKTRVGSPGAFLHRHIFVGSCRIFFNNKIQEKRRIELTV